LRRDDLVAADLGHPSGLYNSAVLLRPPERLEDVVADLEAFYDGHGAGDVELWSPWPTPDLAGRGWELEGHPPLLIRPTAARLLGLRWRTGNAWPCRGCRSPRCSSDMSRPGGQALGFLPIVRVTLWCRHRG
ncbi:MAG: hypothetical protein LC799_10485, partial [Actinobacteria bacterium]|nr:hypothetical protein [Actinomycetota bacterium]